MVRPRWLSAQRVTASRLWHHWDHAVAFWAGLNLVLVLFDITYIPLRTFWLQRNLTPLPPLPVVVPLKALPDITPYYDPVKGIEPHRETQAYLEAFERLDQQLLTAAGTAAETPLLRQQAALTVAMINENPFAASGNSGTLEKIKNRLRQRAGEDSAKQAAERLLSAAWLKQRSWSEERRFWRQQVLPLVATSYWRAIDDNGRPIDHFWRLDLLLFQGVFALDILLRMVRLRRRFPGLSWRDALLRRWLDLPLLLPFWRVLRLLPVVERLSRAGLINVEPLRAAVSRAVVSLLALELFEVLALQLVDGTQSLVCSPMWPRWIRGLRSHQSVAVQEDQQVLALMRLWGPLVLEQITPRLAPELQSLLGHALQQQLRDVPGGLMVPSGLSRQLAAGLVERLLDVSRSTAQRLSREDERQTELVQRAVDRFWEELASALEQEGRLEQTQQLLCALLQQIKLNYVAQVNRAGIGALMDELDEITLPLHTALQPPTPGA
jgi:hypothetical protein